MRLLKIEWLKLKKYKTFYVLSGLFLLLYILINYAVSRGTFSFEAQTGTDMKESVTLISEIYSFPDVWANMAYYLGWAMLFVCVFVIINISNEYQFKTQRQHIIDGYSRLDFLHSKVLLIVLISVVLTILYTVLSIIFGLTHGGGTISNGAEHILYVFVALMNYLSFCALLALFIKRSGLTIILFFAFIIFEEMAVTLLNKLVDLSVDKFFPLDCSDSLFPFPLGGLAKAALQKEELGIPDEFTSYVIISGLYILLYYGIARWRMQKADL